jgi:hypothetical protein
MSILWRGGREICGAKNGERSGDLRQVAMDRGKHHVGEPVWTTPSPARSRILASMARGMKQALPLRALDEERTETACMRLYHESNFPMKRELINSQLRRLPQI